MKTFKGRILYLPIEVKKREFLSKLLLACVAAEKGFVVIIGKQSKLRKIWRKFPEGIYFHKDTFPARIEKKEFYDQIEYGNRFIALDEEGLLIDSEEKYLKLRAHKATIDSLDILFTWGKYQADVLKERYADIAEKVMQVGNPRLDLLRKEFRDIFSRQTSSIISKYGKIILINSNFISREYIGGKREKNKKIDNLKKINQEAANICFGVMAEKKEKLYQEFIKMIDELRNSFSNYTILIRPHPAESSKRWISDVGGFSNVYVVHGGSVIPFILASELIIHNNCTTAIESFLLDKPVVAFLPFYAESDDKSIPNNLSRKAESVSELLKTAIGIIKGKQKKSSKNFQRKKYLSQYISAIDAFASERIVDALVKLETESYIFKLPFLHSMLRYCELAYSSLKSTLERLIKGKESQERHKAGDISMNDVKNGINSFQKVSARFSTVKGIPVYRNCFIVVQEENQNDKIKQK